MWKEQKEYWVETDKQCFFCFVQILFLKIVKTVDRRVSHGMSDKQQPFLFSLKVKFVVSYLEDIIIVENLEAIEKNKDENKPSVFLESLTNVLFFFSIFPGIYKY